MSRSLIALLSLCLCATAWIQTLAATTNPPAEVAVESARGHNQKAQAEARIGRWSRALAELRQAERLAPGNAILQENLRLVRAKLELLPPNNLLRPLAIVPLNLWAGAALFSVWLSVGIGIARRLFPSHKDRLGAPLALLTLASAGLLGLLGLSILGQRLTPNAVVIAKDAILRQGPVDAAKPIGTLADGTEIRIRREHFGWYEVGPVTPRSPALGWLPPGHLIVVGP